MSDAEADSKRWGKPAQVVGLQAAISVTVAALALMWSFDEAKAALLGGMVACLPNAYFAWAIARAERRPRRYANAEPEQAVWAAGKLLGQWATKTVMMAALLVLAIVFAKPAALAFICGFGAALLTQLGAPLLWRRERVRGP